MQQEKSHGSVHELMSRVLDSTGHLDRSIRAAIRPVSTHRDRLRSYFDEFTAELPTDGTYLSVAAVDGARTSTQLFLGDHLVAMAVAVISHLGSGDAEITGDASWSTFAPHSPANESLAKAVMLADEMSLTQTTTGEDVVTILDGSHSTALTALMEAATIPHSREDQVACSDLISARCDPSVMVDVMSNETVVACPKADSRTTMVDHLRDHGESIPVPLPDKVLASLILEEGEVVALPPGGNDHTWTAFDVMSHQSTSGETPLKDALLEARETAGTRTAHIRPWGAQTAITVETKASLDDFATMEIWQAIAEDCAPPHTQEPVCQYIADYLAKHVSSVARVQLDSAVLDVTETAPDLAELLTRRYRTV